MTNIVDSKRRNAMMAEFRGRNSLRQPAGRFGRPWKACPSTSRTGMCSDGANGLCARWCRFNKREDLHGYFQVGLVFGRVQPGLLLEETANDG